MSNDQTTPAAAAAEPTSTVIGGEPTPEEARLAAQLDGLPENPTEEPDAAAAPATANSPAPAPEASATTDAEAAATLPAKDVPAPAQPPAAAIPTSTPITAPNEPRPEPPRDFEAAADALYKQFDGGELTAPAYQAELRKVQREEAAYAAKLAVWEDRQERAAAASASDFNTVAVQWEAQHADFMANPLRRAAMQQAIATIDAETDGRLSSAELFEQAQKAAFEIFGYSPPAATGEATAKADAQAAIAKATQDRQPPRAPTTLGNAPAAAAVEQPANSAYAALDQADISDLEDRLARLPRDQIEAFLRDAPGANSRGSD